MKNLTKISAISCLLIVLALPLATNAAKTYDGLYWPSYTSVTSTIYAYAETRGSMLTVESSAHRNSDGANYAFDSGTSWSKISVARPGFSGTVVNNGQYWDSLGYYVNQPDYTTLLKF